MEKIGEAKRRKLASAAKGALDPAAGEEGSGGLNLCITTEQGIQELQDKCDAYISNTSDSPAASNAVIEPPKEEDASIGVVSSAWQKLIRTSQATSPGAGQPIPTPTASSPGPQPVTPGTATKLHKR